MGRLDGKVAVVTGGANGIGRACCERFAEEGARVVVADLSDVAGAETVARVEALGGRAVFVHADAASSVDTDSVMDRAETDFGGVDVLVTAAGVSHAGYQSGNRDAELALVEQSADVMLEPHRAFTETPLADWQRVLAINLTGTLIAVQAASRRMIGQGRGGSIVTIASIAAKVPEAGPLAYGVSKAGVWMLTKQAARALAPVGIRVNSIGPGFIDTNMTAVISEMPDIAQLLMSQIPMGRMGTPREVANTALFLASDEASYFTGEILHPDGGWYTD